ncbi:MAG TPA: [citrate (pro-3S)-lyase] ligase, partial [Clostridiaceae bacterium]|nr:[citrate (pro-3S)-lyase] ligase [Clostridiaceae bacterium]
MQINQLNLASNDYEKWRQLLLSTGLHPEENLDETWGLFESGKLIATGSRQG